MIDLKQYGYIETEKPPENLIPGRVTEQQRSQYTVITEFGEVIAMLKGTFYFGVETRGDLPCVGDFVLLQYNESGPSLITKLLPRRSKFSRADYSGSINIFEQVVATNFDYVFILSSLNKDFNINRILRYLTQARQSGGKPVVILTKADLTEDCITPLEKVKKAAFDVPVHVVSSRTGYGLDTLTEYLQPEKTIVFLGMSGVGKSSLLNALMKKDVMVVKEIREDDSRGRHTTTHRQLFMLPPLEGVSGAMIIDTPGMRELGLLGAGDGISEGFGDIENLFSQCRFRDCLHKTEPGCAVLKAISDGLLSRNEWELYVSLKRENNSAEGRMGKNKNKKFTSKNPKIKISGLRDDEDGE